MSLNKRAFIKDVENLINSQINNSFDIYIYIGNGYNQLISEEKIIKIDKINFDINFEKEIFNKFILDYHKVYLHFKNVIFEYAISFQNITLEILELKEVIFKKNVGIKAICLDTLILRPYEINGNVVVNVDNYANDEGLIFDSKKYYIKKIEFEDPHICNAKIFFIGTNFEYGNFKNRLLDNVVFQNCDFTYTYFLNSFLSKTTFLNCKFPLIKNSFNSFFLPNAMNLFLTILCYIFVIIYSVLIYENSINSLNKIELLIYIIPTIIFCIFIFYLILRLVEIIISRIMSYLPSQNNNSLVNYHIGLADERKMNSFDKKTYKDFFSNFIYILINSRKRKNRYEQQSIYKRSLLNINSIYNDLKVNFKNSSNLQLSGDFHYSHNYNKIILADRFFDTFVLKVSYIINGFGERFMRSIISIILIFSSLVFFIEPNQDYISTSATPPFLLNINLPVKDNKIVTLPISYTEKSFIITSLNKEKSFINGLNFYAFDNRFDFNFVEQKIPKLSEKRNEFLVRLYYASSHVTYPFSQESKKWFQNITKFSYSISILSTILIWLHLVGMATAIFNRIRR